MKALFNQATLKLRIANLFLYVPAIIIVFVMGCEPKEEIDPVVQKDRIELINDEEELNRDLVLLNDTIKVRNMASRSAARIAQSFDLILVAQINSSSVDGYLLQSTSVALDCEKAVIGFNVADDPYKGGIKIVTTDECIKITSSIDFNDADIHNVHLTDNKVYAATGTSNWVDNQAAVLEIFTIDDNKLSIDNTVLLDYAGQGFWNTDGDDIECSEAATIATPLVNGTNVQIINTNLTRGNHTVNDNQTGQEQLYYCFRTIPSTIQSQTYSRQS